MVARILYLLVLINFYNVSYADDAKFLTAISNSAHELYLDLQLVNLKVNKTSEQTDELYMSIATFPSEGRTGHYLIPSAPKYWLSSHVNKINKLSLWHGILGKGNKITIQLSLIEKDLPPFDADDLVGTIVVKAKNIDGKLFVEWSKPYTKNDKLPKVADNDAGIENNLMAKKYSLISDDANYDAKLSFITYSEDSYINKFSKVNPAKK